MRWEECGGEREGTNPPPLRKRRKTTRCARKIYTRQGQWIDRIFVRAPRRKERKKVGGENREEEEEDGLRTYSYVRHRRLFLFVESQHREKEGRDRVVRGEEGTL